MTLQETIRTALESRLTDLHVSFPARVVKINFGNGCVDIQPCIKRKYADGTINQLPIITNATICYPRANNAYISFPIKVGDYVYVIISERSLDIWKSEGGIVDPQDARKHHLSDAIVIPGCYPFTDTKELSDKYLRIINDKLKIDIDAAGKIKIDNGANELITTLLTLVDDLINALVLTGGGLLPMSEVTKAALNSTRSKLESFKL